MNPSRRGSGGGPAMSNGKQSKPSNESRRAFMKTAALGAGAAAFAAKSAQAATPDVPERTINRPKPFVDLPSAPEPKPFAFPATGADVFAQACKEEGLAALFCCPGNYNIITAVAEAGIPAYGGRCEGPMCSAADAFIRVTGEIAAASGTEGP